MKWKTIHHPDWCPTVIGRRIAEDVLDLMSETIRLVISPGRALWSSYYPSMSAYYMAIHRLRKEGLVAYRRTGGKMPILQLTEMGETRVSPACRLTAPWPRSWNNRWYLLSYDVPEESRGYRDVLRLFLKKKRMGCLHKSVWITPSDIRPEFDDLAKAGSVDTFAYLFEAQTVLGRGAKDIVETAWNMSRLRDQQQWYMKVYRENLDRARTGKCNREDLHTLAREEQTAYLTVMESDPFLPHPLWPEEYAGKLAWIFHRDSGIICFR